MKQPKVLIAAPTARQKDYCFNQWFNQLVKMDYGSKDAFIVDNSADQEYVKMLQGRGLKTAHVSREGKHPVEFLAESQNVIREYFLKGDYDYLFMLESDVFVPLDTLKHMVSFGNPIHNITYFIKEGKDRTICLQMIQKIGGTARAKILPPELAHVPFNGKIQEFKDFKISYDTELFASGLGCSLIHRSALEQIEFRHDHKHDAHTGTPTFADTFFHADAAKLEIPNILDTSLIALHKPSQWII